MTYEREKEKLIDGLRTIKQNGTDVYLIENKTTQSVWGLVLYEPSNTLLSISYNGIWGYSTSSIVKPTREHGTGFMLVSNSDFRGAYMSNTAFNDIPEIAEMAERLLMNDIRAKHVFITKETLAIYKYKNLQEYIDKWCKNTTITKLTA